jgi:hypothetical protein
MTNLDRKTVAEKHGPGMTIRVRVRVWDKGATRGIMVVVVMVVVVVVGIRHGAGAVWLLGGESVYAGKYCFQEMLGPRRRAAL